MQGDSFQMSMQSGAQAKARELGVEVTGGAPEYWMSGLQRQVLDDLIAQQPTALCIAAVDPQALIAPLKAASDAGIDIFSLDTYIGSNGGDYTGGDVTFPLSYIASDNVAGGRMACQALLEALGGKGKIYVQKAHEGITTLEQREQGCREAIAATNGGAELVAVDVNDADGSNAKLLAAAVLKRVPDLGAVFLADPYGVEGVNEALRGAGLDRTVAVATFDADPWVIEALRSDAVDIVIAQHPYEISQKCVEYAVAAAKGDTAAIPKRTITGFTIVTRDNVDTEDGQRAIYGNQ